jgi:hypothetical protein
MSVVRRLALPSVFTDSEPIDRHACILARRGGSLGTLFHPVTGKRLLSLGMILPEHLINEI